MKKFILAFFTFHFSLFTYSLLPLRGLGGFTCFAQTNSAIFPFNFDDAYVALNGTTKIDVLVENTGSATITNLSYTVRDAAYDAASREREATLAKEIPAGEQGYATFRIASGSEVGLSQMELTITRVNDEINEAAAIKASSQGKVHTLAEKLTKKTIEEEYTGTWCGWCPRGTVGMELLAEKYPDTYIGAAFHYDDEFYFSAIGYHDGFPACELNRHVNIDPYNGTTGNEPFGIEKDFLREQNILPEGSLAMKAEWTDENKKTVRVHSDMRFVYNSNDEYSLYYIVTEDGKSGTSQRSYYANDADYAGDPYMAFWYKGGTTNIYNHVVVAFAGREKGIEDNSFRGITVGMEKSFDYTLDLSAAKISNKSNLHMIVCLIDKTTGTIINTDFGSIGIYDPTAITSLISPTPSAKGKYLKDGRLVIEKNGRKYNALGIEKGNE